jgi:hypothetical protein
MTVDLPNTYRLSIFEEAIGILHELIERDGTLRIRIGKIQLILPAEMEQSLRPLINQKIAILRTDIPNRAYLFRVLNQESHSDESICTGGLLTK